MAVKTKAQKMAAALLKGKSPAEAYKEAGYRGSEKQADALALSQKMKEEMKKLRQELRRQAEEEGLVTPKELIRELASITFADIGDYLQYKTLTEGENSRLILRFADSDRVNTRNISEMSVAKDGKVTFKLYSKEKALFKLIDLLGLSEEENGGSEELPASLKTAALTLFEEDGDEA